MGALVLTCCVCGSCTRTEQNRHTMCVRPRFSFADKRQSRSSWTHGRSRPGFHGTPEQHRSQHDRDVPQRLPGTPEAAEVKVNDSDRSALARGKALYAANCIGCHFKSGQGMERVFPPLKGSADIQAKAPSTVLQVIIGGGTVVTAKQQPWPYHMPAFGRKLSDQQIADLATYIRNAWGNRAGSVSAAEVEKVRKEDRPSTAK